MAYFTKAELQRFAVKAQWRGGCLIWTAAKNADGYGCFFFRGRKGRAHRLAYTDAWGEIPEGMLIRHTCDNPACVNPAHLVAGTDADNARDKAIRDRARTKISTQEVRAIRSDHRALREIAASHGVSTSAVCLIKSGKRRQHVGG